MLIFWQQTLSCPSTHTRPISTSVHLPLLFQIETQVKAKFSELMKGEAVVELERKMHSALDDALVTIKREASSEGQS